MNFWEQVICRQCEKLTVDCDCNPIPCPFCDREFGFIQDWNVHLYMYHRIINHDYPPKQRLPSTGK